MTPVVWDVDGWILTCFLPKGEMINSVRYQETLKKLAAAMCRNRSDSQNSILHQESGECKTSHYTCSSCFETKEWTILHHPPCSL